MQKEKQKQDEEMRKELRDSKKKVVGEKPSADTK